jgi:L-carnitine CoA-transferase
MWANKELPVFGTLSGVKVVHATLAVSGPFSAQLLADYGADVIWVENALAPDITRFSRTYAVESDRKNQRNLALNIPTPEGKEILLGLLKDAEIFIENSKGGQYESWGLTDEVLWKVNPKLVIGHISGFGLTGRPEYIKRAALDTIAQAFSGYTWANANPTTAPYGGPQTADFMSAMFATISVLAALVKARATGIGESIDIAMYEVMMRSQQYISDWFSTNRVVEQSGYPSPYGGSGSFPCKDGKYVQVYFIGSGVLRKAIPLVGLEYGTKDYPENTGLLLSNTDAGKRFTEAVKAYLASKTADEAEAEMLALGLPASKINDYQDVEDDPQVKAREMISEWKSFKGTDVRAVSIVPKFKKNPGKMWRPAPYMGMDNEEILGELGYSSEKVEDLYKKMIIAKDAEMKLCVPFGEIKKAAAAGHGTKDK